MFRGVVPIECMAQILRAVPFETWPGAYVCCSGTLRFEACLRSRHEKIPIVGNDVSAYSCVLGAVASGAEFEIRFHGRLQFIEDLLGDEPRFIRRAAAIIVASQMADYRGKNAFARTHFNHYAANFAHYLDKAQERLGGNIKPLGLRGFHNGDWREHVENAIAQGQGIVAFPPFFQGDYEAMHRFVHDNITWPAPNYPLYDPKTLPQVVDRIASSGVPYCVLTDQILDGREPFLKFTKGRKVPHYSYGIAVKSVLSHIGAVRSAPFRFEAVTSESLGPKTIVAFARAERDHAAYIKDRYLARNIVHTPAMMEFFIYLDHMLLGVIGYSLSKVRYKGENGLYLMSDVCTTRQAKLSKLIARMALSRELVGQMERKLLNRFEFVVTTARTKNAVSMKYRGIYELWSRRPADDAEEGFILQYGGKPQSFTLQECYEWWRAKYHAAR